MSKSDPCCFFYVKDYIRWCNINERGHYEMDKLKILKKWGNFIIKFDV